MRHIWQIIPKIKTSCFKVQQSPYPILQYRTSSYIFAPSLINLQLFLLLAEAFNRKDQSSPEKLPFPPPFSSPPFQKQIVPNRGNNCLFPLYIRSSSSLWLLAFPIFFIAFNFFFIVADWRGGREANQCCSWVWTSARKLMLMWPLGVKFLFLFLPNRLQK